MCSWKVLVVLLLIFTLVMALWLARRVPAHYFAGAGAVITGGRDRGGRPGGRHGDRVKDLSKHPRTKSEKFVIDIAEQLTGCKFPTVNPTWLRYKGKYLELDGYCKELGIAIEFSGPLHTKWYSDRESYESYFERIARDHHKKIICAENGVKLIVIDSTLPRGATRLYLESRLYDAGVIQTRPPNYTPEQVVEPFRNQQIEHELGLKF